MKKKVYTPDKIKRIEYLWKVASLENRVFLLDSDEDITKPLVSIKKLKLKDTIVNVLLLLTTGYMIYWLWVNFFQE